MPERLNTFPWPQRDCDCLPDVCMQLSLYQPAAGRDVLLLYTDSSLFRLPRSSRADFAFATMITSLCTNIHSDINLASCVITFHPDGSIFSLRDHVLEAILETWAENNVGISIQPRKGGNSVGEPSTIEVPVPGVNDKVHQLLDVAAPLQGDRRSSTSEAVQSDTKCDLCWVEDWFVDGRLLRLGFGGHCASAAARSSRFLLGRLFLSTNNLLFDCFLNVLGRRALPSLLSLMLMFVELEGVLLL